MTFFSAKNNTRAIVYASFFLSLGILFPMLAHSMPVSGKMLLPMHIPVLLAGFFLPIGYALIVGVLSPLLSSLLTGMPTISSLPAMVFELATYAVIASLIYQLTANKFKNPLISIYISLISAMLAGRVVGIIVKLITLSFVGEVTSAFFIAQLGSMFYECLLGIVIQVLLIPSIVYALRDKLAIKPLEKNTMEKIV